MIIFGNINKGLEEYRATPGAILVNVREEDEFKIGHMKTEIYHVIHLIYAASGQFKKHNSFCGGIS